MGGHTGLTRPDVPLMGHLLGAGDGFYKSGGVGVDDIFFVCRGMGYGLCTVQYGDGWMYKYYKVRLGRNK